jgi:ribosomal protein S18 acetylase RimI-like enzyme
VKLSIRSVRDKDVDALVELTLLAFVPVFASFRGLLGPDIYPMIWPNWRESQRETVESLCRDTDKNVVLVAEVEGSVVGFLAYKMRPKDDTAEVLLLAVHPDCQNRGIGTRLNERALQELKAAGVKLVELCAGGESSHAPARHSYEKAGYTALPLVRYYKNL